MKVEFTKRHVRMLMTAVENPPKGASRKQLRRIDRVCNIIDTFTEDQEDTDKAEFTFDKNEWNTLKKGWESFEGWNGQKDVRVPVLEVDDIIADAKEESEPEVVDQSTE